MAEHKVDPNGYLDFVHDVDMDLLRPDADLRRQIISLPGRKLIFTNADAPYAERVLAARGLDNLFEDIFDIHRMQHVPKPAVESYDSLCAQLDINPARALFVEDSAHNLAPAKALGMTTIWVNHGTEAVSSNTEEFVDQEIADLNDWLSSIHTMEGTI
jgi:putative hydrolase of the HAD superfamily